MKKINLTLLYSLFAFQLFAQSASFWNRCGDNFDPKPYPSDSFTVQVRDFSFGETTIKISMLHYNFGSEDQVWIEQQLQHKCLKSKYLGSIGSGESGLALPKVQSIKDVWMIYQASEFTGTYYIITKEGGWYEIPGSSLLYDQEARTFYTSVPPECGGCTIGKFSLDSRALQTKHSNGDKPAWVETTLKGNYLYLFEKAEWLRWKKQ